MLSDQASLRSAHAYIVTICTYNFPLAMKYLPCHSIKSLIIEDGEGNHNLSYHPKPATVLNWYKYHSFLVASGKCLM